MLLAAAASYVAPGESSIGVGKTSLSDTPRYLRLIERAIANDSSSLWNTFKTNPAHSARSSKNVRLFRAHLRVLIFSQHLPTEPTASDDVQSVSWPVSSKLGARMVS